jgi:8-oxo-dGTP diphosphatase
MNGGAIFCQDKYGRVLLGCRARGPNAECWILPGGHMERGERPCDAAKREFLEETGVRCYISEHPEHHEHLNDRIVYFFRSNTHEFVSALRDNELSEFGFFTAEEARALKLTPTTRKVLRVMWPEFGEGA